MRRLIQDVDESLRALVRRDALNGASVEISFEAPTKEWASRRNTPTVDIYLYDIREDMQRREVIWEEQRDDTGKVTGRKPPARRYKLSYLVTAWTQRPEDEHRLLTSLLACFIRNETVPEDLLAGALAGTRQPLLVTIALPPPQDRSLSDVWTALGGELKPSLDLVISTPFVDARVETAGPPVLETPKVRVNGEPRSRNVAAGPAPSPMPAPAAADETVSGGVKSQPGRTVRLRGSSSR